MRISELHFQEPIARDYIRELGGSKSGAYHYLNDTSPELRRHLPTGTKYLEPDGDVLRFLDSVNFSFSRQKIVRGCHPLDFVGMVDVIDTVKGLQDRTNVAYAIRKLQNQAQSPEVKSFVEYESGEPFDGKIGILVQDYYGERRGSIVEHPNQRGIYRIGTVTPHAFAEYFTTQKAKEIVEEEVFDGSGRLVDEICSRGKEDLVYKDVRDLTSDRKKELEDALKIINLYKAIRDSGLIPDGYSFQMEFGIAPGSHEIIFYQSRLFRPFEDRANFDVEVGEWGERTVMFNAFGITPKNGIELPVASLDERFIEKYRNEPKVAYEYSANADRSTTPLNIQPRNLGVYLPYQPRNLLEHGHYRWLQKAPVSLCGVADIDELQTAFYNLDEIKVRICSNGVVGGISVVE